MTNTKTPTATPPAGDRFARAIERVLAHEGGFVDNPDDPGGKTRWGISQRTYPHLNIATLTREQAIALYRRDAWTPIRGDALPEAIAFQVLDAAVNHGVVRAVGWLQQMLDLRVDGVVGPLTRAAAADADPVALILAYNAARLDFYVRLRTFPTFGRGWTRRIAANLRFAAQDLA
jgi:lysozyme family protein